MCSATTTGSLNWRCFAGVLLGWSLALVFLLSFRVLNLYIISFRICSSSKRVMSTWSTIRTSVPTFQPTPMNRSGWDEDCFYLIKFCNIFLKCYSYLKINIIMFKDFSRNIRSRSRSCPPRFQCTRTFWPPYRPSSCRYSWDHGNLYNNLR